MFQSSSRDRAEPATTERQADRSPAPTGLAAQHVSAGQLGLGLRVSARPLRLSRDLRDVPLDRYRLPTDGRKWQQAARDRMVLADWLATHGDADGSRIFPSVQSAARRFGWSRRKTFYLLADLGKGRDPEHGLSGLGLLASAGRYTREHGTRVRRMNLSGFLGESCTPAPGSGVHDSRAGVQSNDAPNRHLTATKPKTPREDLARDTNSVEIEQRRKIQARDRREWIDSRQRYRNEGARVAALAGQGPDLVREVNNRAAAIEPNQDPAAAALWDKIIAGARRLVNRQSFETWFRGTCGESLVDNRLRVRVPGPLFSKRLSETYASTLRQILADIGASNISLEFLDAETGSVRGIAERSEALAAGRTSSEAEQIRSEIAMLQAVVCRADPGDPIRARCDRKILDLRGEIEAIEQARVG